MSGKGISISDETFFYDSRLFYALERKCCDKNVITKWTKFAHFIGV